MQNGPILIFSTDDLKAVARAQARFGPERTGKIVEPAAGRSAPPCFAPDHGVKSPAAPIFPILRLRKKRFEVVPLVRMGADRIGKEIRICLGRLFDGTVPLSP